LALIPTYPVELGVPDGSDCSVNAGSVGDCATGVEFSTAGLDCRLTETGVTLGPSRRPAVDVLDRTFAAIE